MAVLQAVQLFIFNRVFYTACCVIKNSDLVDEIEMLTERTEGQSYKNKTSSARRTATHTSQSLHSC